MNLPFKKRKRFSKREKFLFFLTIFLFFISLSLLISIVYLSLKENNQEIKPKFVKPFPLVKTPHVASTPIQATTSKSTFSTTIPATPGPSTSTCSPPTTTPPPGLCTNSSCIITAANFLESMNSSADPCDDFYNFMCGNYDLHHYPYESFLDKIGFRVNHYFTTILEIPQSENDSKVLKMTKDYYNSCTLQDIKNQTTMESKILDYIEKYMDSSLTSSSWNDSNFDFIESLVALKQNFFESAVISISFDIDAFNNTNKILQLGVKNLNLKKENVRHLLKKLQERTNFSNEIFEKTIEQFVNFSDALSKNKNNFRISETLDDIDKINVSELIRQSPNMDWIRLLRKLFKKEISLEEEVLVVNSNVFYDFINIILNQTKSTLSNTMTILTMYKLFEFNILAMDPSLPSSLPFSISQIKKHICLSKVENVFGVLLGSVFIENKNISLHQDMLLNMANIIRDEFILLIQNNSWMSPEVKQKAIQKAENMGRELFDFGFNSSFIDQYYQQLNISSDDFFENNLNYAQFAYLKEIQATLPENTHEGVVNAFYNYNLNALVIPAGICQVPVFSPEFPKPLNFGGVGLVIGHEIGHAFDNNGRYFDHLGNYKMLWENEEFEEYQKRIECLVNQYSNYPMPHNFSIDGNLTLSENMADEGGLKASYYAYKRVNQEGGGQKLPGLPYSDDQIFFMQYAGVWCNTLTNLKKYLKDVHSPPPARFMIPLQNFDSFSEAFNCPLGSKMNPREKCTLW